MFLFTMFFVFWRILQILTLIPTMGMLAWFVHGFVEANALTPNYILVLFIVSVLALAWAIFTLFSYHRSSTNATMVAIVDLLFVGAFIAAIWYLRDIRLQSCSNVSRDANWRVDFAGLSLSGPDWDLNTDKSCAMLKASWAFAIMNCIMFFFTSVLACMNGDRLGASSSHHHHDRKSYRDGRYHGSRRSHSHHSHSRRSSHSRRVYV
ncbi:hypothetical protein VD0004_g3104 [Verticillium dahliae]|uniref:MARVEL domain-containing protein n=1 Tax=Verticillium dahliae TaxID=27337 RepID=A0A444RVW9_VERDA|nr:hypothetical protein VD0004_g3104 [Verticillium dahliae]PNH76933.1 hypothetical protein VD0001_g656 [Verticillium dahliae]RXG45308.1 hypothetical protein VDGE_06727 [Verticillium dahliae]